MSVAAKSSPTPVSPDPRHISHGREIPTETYSDQPYIVQTDDGAWLCCVTTGPGHEGEQGQHVTTMRSTDLGLTWSDPVPVEPGEKRENSYAVMLKVPSSGRIYIFYNHNTDNVRVLQNHNGGTGTRVDSLGHFVCKYSDDHGRSWSAGRYDLPARLFQCDRENVHGGTLCFFWNVGKPFVREGIAYVSLHKVGQMGRGFFQKSEGVLLASDNILTERDASKLRWETLPDGDIGLRTPPDGGPISEEQSYSLMSDGSIYCVYRSIDGYPVEVYSRDGGHTWTEPRYKCYADGRRMKHPRAANFAWRCRNGKYLYWFHNHGGAKLREQPDCADSAAYNDRNPVWLSAGIEIETPGGREIAWSEPEIAIYDSDPFIRMSYPDLVEADDNYYVTETQKDIARVHQLSKPMLEAMWHMLAVTLGVEATDPGQGAAVAADKCVLSLGGVTGTTLPTTFAAPAIPHFVVRTYAALDNHGVDTGNGLALEFWLTLPDLTTGRVLLCNQTSEGRGFCLRTAADGALEIALGDGQTDNRWTSDRVLQAGCRHHVVVNIDGGPRIVSYVVDGRFLDGGDERQFGWGRFSPHLRHVVGSRELRIDGSLDTLRVYGRILRTAEALRHSRIGR